MAPTPVLVDDSSQSPVDDGSITPPELLQDVPQLPSATIRDASVQRGTTDEAVFTTTTGDDAGFTIQVSGFNGASSPQPYFLRVTVVTPAGSLPCSTRELHGWGDRGVVAGAAGSGDADVDFGRTRSGWVTCMARRRRTP